MRKWLLVLTLGVGLSMTCSKYMCAPSSVALEPETCAYGVQSASGKTSFYLQECLDDIYTYCPPLTQPGNSTCEVPPAAPLHLSSAPGEPCALDLDCVLEGICMGGVCSNPSNICTYQTSCDPGMYCNVTTSKGPWQCVPQVGANGACTSDYMCQNAYGCNNGKCVKYMSLAPGLQVDNCNTGASFLCQNILCYSDKTASYCAGNVTSSLPLPVFCQHNSNCTVTASGHSYSGVCSCSYGTMGNAYCSLFPGDYPHSQYLLMIQSWLSNPNINKCNTVERTALACITYYLPPAQADAFLYYYYYTFDYAAIQDMDQCARTIYNQNYWSAYEAYISLPTNQTNPESASVLSVTLLLTSLLLQ